MIPGITERFSRPKYGVRSLFSVFLCSFYDSTHVLSPPAHPPEAANFSELCTQLNPGPFGNLQKKKNSKSCLYAYHQTLSRVPECTLGGGGRRAAGCASETEPERCFSLNTEGSERKKEIFWELWKMKCSRLSTYGSRRQLSDPPKARKKISNLESEGGKTKRNQMRWSLMLVCWLKF